MIVEIAIGVGVAITLIGIGCLFAWYRIVPPSEAHLVVTPKKKMVCSPDPKLQKNGGESTYFAIPSIPFIGRKIRQMDVTIKELIGEMETYEKDQARYKVRFSIKYRIENVERASETFVSDSELQKQLDEIVRASVRAVTVKYNVVETRANKKRMSEEIEKEIIDDLNEWGLKLINFVLVDFQDTEDSAIISDISKRREVEIASETRQLNAEKEKLAKIKEAEALEASRRREIEKDEQIAMREQDKDKAVAELEKEAKKEQLEITKVEQVKNAEIQKEKAIVEANQAKEVAIVQANQEKEAEAINKEQKELEGEGDKLREEQKAIGAAAPIREKGRAEAEIIEAKGLAEALVKDEMQKALNKFEDKAIRALVAEQIVAKDEAVGIKTAEALSKADVKVFAGNKSGEGGFQVSELIEAMKTGSSSTADAFLDRLKMPQNLGIGADVVNAIVGKETKKPTTKKQA